MEQLLVAQPDVIVTSAPLASAETVRPFVHTIRSQIVYKFNLPN